MAVQEQGKGRRRREYAIAFGTVGGFLLLMWLVDVAGGDDGPKNQQPVRTAERQVSSAEVSPWPFTVSGGTLRCRPGSGPKSVTFQPAGMTDEYGLNGAAQSSGYPRPESFWAVDPQAAAGSGLRISLEGAIAAGAALC
ncbi:hypothetical protein [Kitasatospora cineracea]|uniref:hypothetical protein n=1 Tax=Kitasatospora cineracea TaxID=88074 RepID=UPI000F5051A9|nr:hypothetical protein [Kitasatospora cineracea]